MLPLLKTLFWYFCLVIRELKKRLRDTQLTCKTKEKRAVFWLLLFFFKGVIYVYAHEYFWLMLSSSDAWYCCIPMWIWIRKQFGCMLFCQNQTTSFMMLFINAHNLRSTEIWKFIYTVRTCRGQEYHFWYNLAMTIARSIVMFIISIRIYINKLL